MSCDDLKDSYELYALGLLEGEEKDELESHLARGCETCLHKLTDAHAVNALLLSTTIPEVVPPARLKRRLAASFGLPSSGWTWAAALAAGCMLVIALWLGDQERVRSHELARVRSEVIQISSDRDRVLQALSLLNQPETRQVGFGNGPRGNIFLNQTRGILLLASGLPKVDPGKALEMWVIPKTGTPRPAGVFSPNPDGSALNLLPGAIDLASVNAIAVTVEPQSGSNAPTTTPIIAAKIGP
jgi:anti-sigma-K factor RskA